MTEKEKLTLYKRCVENAIRSNQEMLAEIEERLTEIE